MARRGNRRTNSAGPIIGAIALTALVTASATMMLTANRSGGVAGFASDVSGSIGRFVSAPVRWVGDGASSIGSFFGGSKLNAKLKAENASLLTWRDQARAMADRLDAYERLHGITGEQLPQGLTGRMIGESAGTFSHAGIVNVGSKTGVEVNWIVLNQNGLVGRVIAVGADTSRVLLLADGDSRVPVMGETTRARAIASGDKTAAPRLAHLNTPALMRDGERVMTSGDDGIFPRGIAVGQAGIAPDQQWHVRLASNASPIDFVRLIPPSNFPPPLDPVTPPPLTAPPEGASQSVSVLGGLLPLAPGAAPVPTAATPEAIRAAQTELARKTAAQAEANQALTKKLLAERDAAREAARRAEAARVAAEKLATERRTSPSPRREAASRATQETPATLRQTKKLDPNSVPIAPSALNPAQAEPKKAPEPAPVVEGPTK
jgi:rod shape-determining protein MreC